MREDNNGSIEGSEKTVEGMRRKGTGTDKRLTYTGKGGGGMFTA